MERLRTSFASRLTYETVEVLNRPATVRRGTVNGKLDYDTGWTSALLARSRSFLDIGCNVGTWPMLAKLSDATRRVVAVDANPKALAITADNLISNGFDDVSLCLAFVSDSGVEELDFYAAGAGAAGSRYKSHIPSATDTFRVRTTTIGDICHRFGVSPDFIKIDVEGAEIEVLRGARTIRKHRPRILVEVHRISPESMEAHGNKVLEWAAQHDFDTYYLSTGERISSARSFADRGRCHLLLIPAGDELPPEVAGVPQGAPLAEDLIRSP